MDINMDINSQEPRYRNYVTIPREKTPILLKTIENHLTDRSAPTNP